MTTEIEANDEAKAAPTPGNPPAQPSAHTRLARVRDWLPLVMSVLAFTVSITTVVREGPRGSPNR